MGLMDMLGGLNPAELVNAAKQAGDGMEAMKNLLTTQVEQNRQIIEGQAQLVARLARLEAMLLSIAPANDHWLPGDGVAEEIQQGA